MTQRQANELGLRTMRTTASESFIFLCAFESTNVSMKRSAKRVVQLPHHVQGAEKSTPGLGIDPVPADRAVSSTTMIPIAPEADSPAVVDLIKTRPRIRTRVGDVRFWILALEIRVMKAVVPAV